MLSHFYDPILVIDLEKPNVFIYADKGHVKGVRQVIWEICDEREEDILTLNWMGYLII